MRSLARVAAAAAACPTLQSQITLPTLGIDYIPAPLASWTLSHPAFAFFNPSRHLSSSAASCDREFSLSGSLFSSHNPRTWHIGGLKLPTRAAHFRHGHLGGHCNTKLQDPSCDHLAPPSLLLRILPFHRSQLRNCSGNNISHGQSNNATSKPEERLADAAALDKLTSLVEGWHLETEGERSQRGKKSMISPGMLDEWNFDDWNELDAQDLVEQMNKGNIEALRLQQERSDGTEMQEIEKQHLEIQRTPPGKFKRIYGVDKCLTAKVTVEFTEATSLVDITPNDINKLFSLSKEDEERFYPEGLPNSIKEEFDVSGSRALLIRSQVLKLCDHLKSLSQKNSIEAPSSSGDQEGSDKFINKQLTLTGPRDYLSQNAKKKLSRERRLLERADLGSKKHIVLDGLPGSGKSIALAMIVQWARAEGWLVCYVPSAKRWTHGDLYYKNMLSGLWDTPVQARSVLENFLKSHVDILEVIPCRVFDPVPLGEGPGEGLLSGPQEISVQETFTLKDLIDLGIKIPHAAVGVVVRLRKELSLVEELPVLIAVDEFNNWFTFSGFHEAIGEFGRRQIHAKELAMVHAFRDFTCGPFVIGAFSHSTNVGKLPKQLSGIPLEAKVFLNRFNFLEASIMLKHYMRQLSPKAKFGKRARRALYMLTNGNATELRDTAFLKAAGTREISSAEALA